MGSSAAYRRLFGGPVQLKTGWVAARAFGMWFIVYCNQAEAAAL